MTTSTSTSTSTPTAPHPEWRTDFIEQVARGRFVVFIGAGASASCVNDLGNRPPTWRALLLDCAARLSDALARRAAEQLIESGEYLLAAEHIHISLRKLGLTNDLWRLIEEKVDGPKVSRYQPSEVYTQLLQLEPDVVITTNFDRIFERAAGRDNFSVSTWVRSPGQSTVADRIRAGDPVLIKIHGCVSDPSSITLTRSMYALTRRDGADTFSAVKALCMTRPVLFVGYRLADPDIQLLLEDSGVGTYFHSGHYLITEQQPTDAHAKAFEASFGIHVHYYPHGAHTDLPLILRDLVEKVADWKSRRSPRP